MRVDPAQLKALVALPVMLGAAGLGTFFWMWGTSWSDMTGVSVGVIYIKLTILQIVFTVLWWRWVKKTPEEPPEPVQLKSMTPGRRVSADRMAQNDEKFAESPLLNRGGGQAATAEA